MLLKVTQCPKTLWLLLVEIERAVAAARKRAGVAGVSGNGGMGMAVVEIVDVVIIALHPSTNTRCTIVFYWQYACISIPGTCVIISQIQFIQVCKFLRLWVGRKRRKKHSFTSNGKAVGRKEIRL